MIKALTFAVVVCSLSTDLHLTASEAVPESASQFPIVDGASVKGGYVDVSSASGGWLLFRYRDFTDSGVEVDRISRDGTLVWRAFVTPLGVEHSAYDHRSNVRIVDGTVRVVSHGDRGVIVECLDLESGKQISRTIEDVKR